MKIFDKLVARSGFPKKNLAQHLFPKQGGITTTFDGETVLADRSGDQTRSIQQGRCYLFDKVNDYLDTGKTISQLGLEAYNDPFSITFNMQSADVAADQRLFGCQDTVTTKTAFLLQLYLGNFIFAMYQNTDAGKTAIFTTSSAPISNNTYHNVIITNDGDLSSSDHVKLYVDGSPVSWARTGGTIDGIVSNAFNLFLAARNINGSAGSLYGGNMDSFAIYPKVLSSAEIAAIQNHEYPTGSTLFYKCDEQSGTIAYDSSGNASHGAITNATLSTFHATQKEYSFQNQVGYNQNVYFDGVYYIALPTDILASATAMSVTCWFKADNTDGSNRLFNFYKTPDSPEVRLDVRSDTVELNVYDAANGGQQGKVFTAFTDTAEWHHVAFTLNKSGTWTGKLYLDGAEVGTPETGMSLTIPAAATGVQIGNLFAGSIKDVRVYNTELSSADITTIYGGGAVPTGLVGQYEIDSTASTSPDISGNDNDGTWTAAASYLYFPRDESDPTKDVLGNALNYSGRVKYNAELVNSNCATFDGTDDYISYGAPLVATANALTFNCKFNASAVQGKILEQSNGSIRNFYYGVVSSKFFVWAGLDGSNYTYNYVDEVLIVDGSKWYDVTASIDYTGASGVFRVWIDGVEKSLTEATVGSIDGGFSGSSYEFAIGREGSSATNYFEGSISDVKIYNAIKTDAEIKDGETDDLLLAVPLSEGAGISAYDVSGNDNHGIITNATLATFWGTLQDKSHYNIVSGFSGRMSFDGSNNYVSMADSDDWDFGTGDFSIDMDVIPEAIGSSYTLVGFSLASGLMQIDQDGLKLRFIMDGSTTFSDFHNMSDGVKYHIAAIRESGTTTIYVDGVSKVSGAQGSAPAINGNVNVGIRADGASTPYLGVISNFRITKGTLTAGDIAAVKDGSEISDGTKLKVSLNGYGNTDADWVDQTANSHDGTVNGSPELIRVPALIDGTTDALGRDISNQAGNYHNNAETELSQPFAPALIQADITCNKEFWFNSGKTAANDVGYSDIIKNVASGDEQDIIFADDTESNKKKDILTYSEAQTGDVLAKIKKFLRII